MGSCKACWWNANNASHKVYKAGLREKPFFGISPSTTGWFVLLIKFAGIAWLTSSAVLIKVWWKGRQTGATTPADPWRIDGRWQDFGCFGACLMTWRKLSGHGFGPWRYLWWSSWLFCSAGHLTSWYMSGKKFFLRCVGVRVHTWFLEK
jgi:hypothetical protein